MRVWLNRLAGVTLVRYVAASGVALAADMGCFLALLALDMPALPASVAAYAIGILVHWLGSSRAVFTDAVATSGPERMRQKAMFVVSALIGLGITALIVGAGTGAGLDPRLAKIAAVAVSFVVTWALRNRIVFSARAPA